MRDDPQPTTCTTCGKSHEGQGPQCEACETGLESAQPATGQGEPTRPPSLVSAGPRMKIVVEVDADPAYFAEVVTEDEIGFPEPPPALCRVELVGSEINIGRANEATSVEPDLDIVSLTGDPAVSSRHAVVRPDGNGGIVILDVGSTNGTFLAEVDSVAIAPGEPTTVELGTPIFVGAWTRLRIVEAGEV